MVRSDGYSIGKIIFHTLNRGRTKPLGLASIWNYWTTLFICLLVTPAMMIYPQFFEWVGVDFALMDLDLGLRWVGLVVMQITFMGFALSVHDHEYVLLATMIHRPVELGVLGVIFILGEIHWQFYLFMFMGVPVPAGVCFLLWRRETQVQTVGDYWRLLAYPNKKRSILGLWLEKLGWVVLFFGFAILVEPNWLLEFLQISQEPLVVGYIRVVGWAYMILGWCYFMNAWHEYDFFYDLFILQNVVGILALVSLWGMGWLPASILTFLLVAHSIILFSSMFFAWLETRQD